MPKPILFYDGACPLCRKEIDHYKRLDRKRDINWIDISTDSETLKNFSLDYITAMKHIHGVTEQSKVVRGVAAFVLVWRKLPYYRWLAAFVSNLHLVSLLDRVYFGFANWRFKRRCQANSCNL